MTIETSDLSKEVKLLFFLFKNAYINNFYIKKKIYTYQVTPSVTLSNIKPHKIIFIGLMFGKSHYYITFSICF